MSVDSTALEQSALERKDRDELLTIAQALGGSPPSRAKKADIITLILQLTGVPASDGATAAAEPAKKAPRARKASSAAPPSGADRPDDEPPAEWELEAAEAPSGDAPAPADGIGQSERGGGDAPRDGQNGDQGRQGRPAPTGPTSDGAPQDDDGDGEGGNRRRRRRGRNRDRVGEGSGQGQGAPGGPEEFTGEPIEVEGYLDLRDEGYGFLRVKGYLPSPQDVYISVKQARQFGLRKGDHLRGASRPALRNEKNPALLRIDAVNGDDPDKARSRRRFESLTPLFPDEKLVMELDSDPSNVTARIIDLISPIGKGQRGLIVSPPKAGKTTIMKQIARSIEVNNPDVHLFVLLVDERPEEVTDMQRWLKGERSTVVASTFDRPSDEHAHVAELTIERAKRLVEDGHDVVIILDGITRLSRAYNLAAPATGRVMSGGIDTGALYPPKKFFGAARNVEEGGSLTILATALVETGSRMDEVIFEEFKGTGNMELRLDRRLAERRIYPAIDVDASSTRHEELLFQGLQLQNVWKLRRVLSAMASEGGGATGLELLIDRMKSFRSNKEFLAEIGKAPGT
ncbi:MAG: transcription termination factor Rho [Microthrixaceae bacterium]